MKRYVLYFLALSLFIYSCKSTKQKADAEKQEERKNYFSVNDYIKSEIHDVDSLPVGITKYVTSDNKTDTAYIQSAEFNLIAQDFICDELKPEIFEKEFSETSFIDETTHAATFTYSTKNNKLELQRADVLASAGAGVNKISSIYLEKIIHKNDMVILKKLLWRAKTSFQIVTSTEVPNHPAVVRQLKLVWGIE